VTATGVFTIEEAYGLNSNRNDGEGKHCAICLTEEKNTLCKPCKHVSVCYACS